MRKERQILRTGKTVICIGGLGDNPEFLFRELKLELMYCGHKVIVLSPNGDLTHSDRIHRVKESCHYELKTSDKVFLVGSSAGASAVRQVASTLEDCSNVRTVLLSQALPRGYWFMTDPLLRQMKKYCRPILLGKNFNLSCDSYLDLAGPLSRDLELEAVKRRSHITGAEARRLALLPPKHKKFTCPTQVLIPLKDRWISPQAQIKFAEVLKSEISDCEVVALPYSGHLLLLSDVRWDAIKRIKKWINHH